MPFNCSCRNKNGERRFSSPLGNRVLTVTDTDVTFLSCYNIIGHIRMDVMTLTSPPSLPLSRPWAGLSVRRLAQPHLLIQGQTLLSSLP
jgi:hypothetical protein